MVPVGFYVMFGVSQVQLSQTIVHDQEGPLKGRNWCKRLGLAVFGQVDDPHDLLKVPPTSYTFWRRWCFVCCRCWRLETLFDWHLTLTGVWTPQAMAWIWSTLNVFKNALSLLEAQSFKWAARCTRLEPVKPGHAKDQLWSGRCSSSRGLSVSAWTICLLYCYTVWFVRTPVFMLSLAVVWTI